VRILTVHGRYRSVAPSGENQVVEQETQALRAAGHDVGLFIRDSDEIASWSLARKATLPVLTVWNPEVHRALSARLRDERPEVVHVHNTFPVVSPAVLHACKDAGVPAVVTFHNKLLLCASGDFFRDGRVCHDCAAGRLTPGVRHGCYRGSRVATLPVAVSLAAHRWTWRHLVSAYIFITEAQRDMMRALDLPEDRTFVKHNFVRPVSPPVAQHHRVAYLGRFDVAKGLPLLMRSWDRFREEHPDSTLRLALAGGGPLEPEVRRWAGGHASVDMPGLLEPQQAGRLLRGSLAALVPSQVEETFGLVAVEAMAAGVAPIATAHGSLPEIITDGVDGLLFPTRSASALARILADVDRDPARFVEMGRRGQRTHAERFRVTDNLEQLLSIYEYAVAHPAGMARTAGGVR
jgi:glycosyltransferase involved in cell wall biosynthesis